MAKPISYHQPEASTAHILLWGREGIGKTYLSASMPKPCLYLTFDPNALNGVNDLINSGAVKATDLPMISYDEGDYNEIRDAYKVPKNPFGLNEIYKDYNFKTLVIDSLSSFFKLALQYGVEMASMLGEKEKSCIEKPGFAGYGIRSVATKEMVFNVINWCNKHKVNAVFIAHEGELVKDQNTGILYHQLSLSGDIPMEITRWCDEAWYMYINGAGERCIQALPNNKIRPLKTRMFDSTAKVIPADKLDLTKVIDAWRSHGKINDQALNKLL